ncbi:MAG TPA: hypothetical protein EYP41_14715 [Anaerolineae bacterium]|nr:hypothetical protein [Anaerolineae bacterium]
MVSLAQSRYTVEELGDRVIVHISSRKHWLQMAVIAVWLVFWLLGWTGTATRAIWNRNDLVLLVWLVFWVTGGLAAIASLVWQLAGEMALEADRFALRVRWQVWGVSWTKAYVASDVRNLGVRPLLYGRYTLGWATKPIMFDYRGTTIHLGTGVNEDEARQIVQVIRPYCLCK